MIFKFPVFFLFCLLTVGSFAAQSQEDDEDDDNYEIGDMIFSRKLDEMMRNTRAGATHIHSQGRDWDITWPNNTIPYTWQPNIDPEKKAMIQSAMKDIMAAVPNCWKFVEKSAAHKHWVEYNIERKPNSCSSSVGNMAITGEHPQYINFGAAHCKHGSMVHELFHTMGFMHEFTRNDRDEYIQVYFERIPKDVQNNFIIDKENNFVTSYYDVPYSFDSLMHYGFNLAGMIKNPVMRNKKNKKARAWDWPDNKIGQRYQFSKGDLLLMARKGKCPDPTIESYPITGASPSDVGVSEDVELVRFCTIQPCSKTPDPCKDDEKAEDTKCKGQCGMISRNCCKNVDV